jgi:hypothetical protein
MNSPTSWAGTEKMQCETVLKGKAIPVTGCGTLRLPHFLDIRLTDGSEVVSPTRWLPYIPRKILGSQDSSVGIATG